MKTVHMIGNAHLDPVWLWRYSDGVDAALATARSACDRLDEYPDFIFTCSTKWFHTQVELLGPELFERICHFVRSGRWQLVGGIVVSSESSRTAVIAPEIFSGSVDSHSVNLTLLRSPYMAHHDPAPAEMRPDQPVADQGNHEFDIFVYPDCDVEIDQIEQLAKEIKMPPITWDLTG